MENEIVSVGDKLKLAVDILKQNNLVDELEPDELVQISNEIGADYTKYERVAKTITYIRKRTLDGLSQVEAFKAAFPDRCVGSNLSQLGNFTPTDREPVKEGEELPRRTIELKARRLENSELYRSIVAILNTSLYTIFAIERIKVLNQALEKINDPDVKDRDKVEYMKTFLQETRKPDKAKELEVNVNLQQNNISIETINKKLSDIASQLVSTPAGSIINLLEKEQ